MADPILNRHSREDQKPSNTSPDSLITDHIDIWTTAIERKSSVGRGTSNKFTLYGIKKLRELILELAVRGKLVPQDVNDEPASILLERIAAEKAQLVKEGKIKKPKPLPEISDDENPFELPQGWALCRFDNVIDQQFPISYGVLVPGDDVENGVPFVRIGDLDIKVPSSLPEKSISCEIDSKYERTRLWGGEILMAIVGSIGKLGVVPASWKGANIARALCRIKPCESISKQYILVLLQSRYMQGSFLGDTRTLAQPTLNIGLIRTSLTPIPPLEEQHRIVAKVDELMSLCDALEAQTEASIGAHQTLVETLLNALLLPNITQQKDSQSASPETSFADSLEPALNDSFVDSWQRIAEHFDTLFTTEASIDTLKQTILQLAVMGKLVEQDPNDEPAAKLLERIAAEKAQLIKDGNIKKQKPLPAITDEEKPFELPVGWSFLRLENMCELITKGSSPKWQGVSYTENPEDVLFVTSENVGAFKMLLDKKKYVERKFNEIEPRSILKKNDFLMNIVGASIGRCAIFDLNEVANINQAVCLIRSFPNSIASKFFLHFFNSHTCIAYMYDKQVENARPNLSMSNIAKFIIPIPPLEEQHRIVAKVDELMTLCDQLKARLSDAQTTQLHLTDAIVEQAI
ncbi:restriction endonuclease subunit S [Shewanella sp. SR43-4]|uniref:restriction endonuclease subunit S n=1 Tax=Shewanella sp. SR43-4 TaxID=2760942 RepID=UPI0015FE0068|nr:restriction endonuclease subunit S [Shewanella sp. SR43-4]MBB1317233.1 restriction endonuclease subunit S [Shewanella sp. SR43-4]